jgi:hypothetical protein
MKTKKELAITGNSQSPSGAIVTLVPWFIIPTLREEHKLCFRTVLRKLFEGDSKGLCF